MSDVDDKVRFVIFSGANERAIIACCRYFINKDIKFSIISRSANDLIFLTKYKKYIEISRSCDSLLCDDMINCINFLVNKYSDEKLVFLPTAESVNRVVLENRERFTSSGLIITLVDIDTYKNVSDKMSFITLSKKFGINVPRELLSPISDEIPFVAKPKYEFSKKDKIKIYPSLILSMEDFHNITTSKYKSEYFFQQYIDGDSYYYLMFFYGDGDYAFSCQKNILQQGNGKSIVIAELCPCPDYVFKEKIVSLFNSLDFRGFVMVEMMYFDGTSYLIEANPRLWGPFELAVKAGFFPDNIFYNKKLNIVSKTYKYMWLTGLMISLSKGDVVRSFFNKKNIIKNVFQCIFYDIYFRKDTLRLFLFELFESVKTYLRRCVWKV